MTSNPLLISISFAVAALVWYVTIQWWIGRESVDSYTRFAWNWISVIGVALIFIAQLVVLAWWG